MSIFKRDQFSIRNAIIATFSDSDVSLSQVAQSDGQYTFSRRGVTVQIIGAQQAIRVYARILENWYFLTSNRFLTIVGDLLRQLRLFSTEAYKTELVRLSYKGDLLTQSEDDLLRLYIGEFGRETINPKSLDELNAWIKDKKNESFRYTYNKGEAAQFRNSQFLQRLLRIFGGITASYNIYKRQNRKYKWPFDSKSDFDFRMVARLDQEQTVSLSYETVGDEINELCKDYTVFREAIFLSGVDPSACMEFVRVLDQVRDGNNMQIDVLTELQTYFEKKPERCPGNQTIILENRMSHYKDSVMPGPNYRLLLVELADREAVKFQEIVDDSKALHEPQVQEYEIVPMEEVTTQETQTGGETGGETIADMGVTTTEKTTVVTVNPVPMLLGLGVVGGLIFAMSR